MNTHEHTSGGDAPRLRLPPWLKRTLPAGRDSGEVRSILQELDLHTVCSGASCPNRCECFARRTATFMILGDRCTRRCRFCGVGKTRRPEPPRADEPQAVAQAAARMNLRHVVITSVTRDDLADGGAMHFVKTIHAVRELLPQASVEVLIPDFAGDEDALDVLLAGRPDVLNHNIETVPRLYKKVRPQALYIRSLELLLIASQFADAQAKADPSRRRMLVKSGLMVGLGESDDEVLAVMQDLRRSGCDMVTIGQYLPPSRKHMQVSRYVEPATFEQWQQAGNEMGFAAVAAGPFIRSSYMAEHLLDNSRH